MSSFHATTIFAVQHKGEKCDGWGRSSHFWAGCRHETHSKKVRRLSEAKYSQVLLVQLQMHLHSLRSLKRSLKNTVVT